MCCTPLIEKNSPNVNRKIASRTPPESRPATARLTGLDIKTCQRERVISDEVGNDSIRNRYPSLPIVNDLATCGKYIETTPTL